MSVNVDLYFLSRTFRIRYGNSTGTAVYIQVSGVNLLVTAAHVVPGLEPGDSVAIRHNNEWQLQPIEGRINCPLGSDVCVIKPQSHFGDGLPEDCLHAGIQHGQDVVYCGFPLGMEMQGLPLSNGWPVPLIKGALFSGGLSREGYIEFLFDTVNNKGFSGGPIIKRDPSDNRLKVMGIVSGYKFDAPIPVRQKEVGGEFVETADYVVQPNSGFMIGVGINLAVEAAKLLI